MAFCAVLWSCGGLFIKLVDWHPLAIAGAESLVAVTLSSILSASAGNPDRLQHGHEQKDPFRTGLTEVAEEVGRQKAGGKLFIIMH